VPNPDPRHLAKEEEEEKKEKKKGESWTTWV
jgi:hypothetical protein